MKLRILIVSLAAIGFMSAYLIVSAQQSDEEVRGAFLSSRPKTTNTNAAPRRRRTPRNTNTGASTTTVKNANTAKNVNGGMSMTNANGGMSMGNANKSLMNGNSTTSPSSTGPIGLGYTLFMRDVNGRTVRVHPAREFHNGDRVKLSLEPNIDGYIYIFDVEDNGTPQMIYPDSRLEGGENWIEAHVPLDVPSAAATDDRLRWFQFYGTPGADHLYIVVTREPLADVPYGDNLVAFCSANKDKCPWKPSPEVWSQIQQAAKADVKIVASNTFGQSQTEKEETATTRGLGLDQTAPQPSVIRMSAKTNTAVLVTILDLVHK